MNISCDMVMDLISLYNDGVASDDTCRAIREHLRGCSACRRAYASYADTKKHDLMPPREHESDALSRKYTVVARHLRRHRLLSNAAVILLILLSAVVGGVGAVKLFMQNNKDVIH